MNQAEEIRRLQEENKLLREALEGLLPIGGVCHPEHCEDLRVEWAAIDDKEKSLFRWYHSCPYEIAWIAQPCALMLWPVALWLWRKNKLR